MSDSKIPVTAVVFTKNEELNIEDCLNSLTNFAEILVIDSNSNDKTVSISLAKKVKVIEFVWNGKYPKKRQWTIDNCEFTTPWLMFIDADERCTPKLISEIRKFVNQTENTFAAGKVKLDYYFSGKRLRFGHKNWKTVILDPSRASFEPIDDLDASGMGELEGHYQPIIGGKVFKFKNGLIHNDNDGIDSWAERHIRYARWEAFLLNNPSVRFNVYKTKSRGKRGLKFTRFQGLGYFLYAYFLKLGFMDGKAGFNYAFGKAWYYWLSNVIANEAAREPAVSSEKC